MAPAARQEAMVPLAEAGVGATAAGVAHMVDSSAMHHTDYSGNLTWVDVFTLHADLPDHVLSPVRM